MQEIKDRIRPDWKPCSEFQMIWTRGNEFPWTHNQFENSPRKPKIKSRMENLDPMRTRFNNLDYIKI